MNTGKYNDIDDNVKIDFPVPEILQHLMDDAEEADIKDDGSYLNLADTIDTYAKNCYADGLITQAQWDTIIMRYKQW